jgi:serine/threonine-protein kinase
VLEDGTAIKLGRYEVLTRIASGGMAEVYAGRILGESGFAKLVAIKVMREELLEEDRFIAMFLDEARVAAHISHPHVVGMLDLGRDPRGVPYLVMDLVIGASAAQLLKGDASAKPEAMPVAYAVEIAAQVAEGLHAAHEARDTLGTPLEIVHRDVSPQNILVGVDGRARITDFGVARAVARLTRTHSAEVKGKARYFSPEQATGRDVDRRSDVFSLGIVLWEMLALRPLFQGRSMLEVHKAVVQQPIPDVRESRPEVPAAVAEVIAHALQRDPAARIASGADLARDLRRAAEDAGVHLPRPSVLAAYVHARAGESVARLTSEIREKTSALDIDVGDLDGSTEGDDDFTDEEPTAIDAEIVQKMLAGGAKSTRPGLKRPGAARKVEEPTTGTSPTMPELARALEGSAPAPRVTVASATEEETSSAATIRRVVAGTTPPRSVPTLPHGTQGAPAAPASAPVSEAPASLAPSEPSAGATSAEPGGPADLEACPRCGERSSRATFAYASDGTLICKRCETKEALDTGDLRAANGIAGMGYGALASGILSLLFNFYFLPSILAVVGAVTYFANVARHPEYRRRMGWQLPFATICAAVGLLLGVLQPVFYVLVILGWASASASAP